MRYIGKSQSPRRLNFLSKSSIIYRLILFINIFIMPEIELNDSNFEEQVLKSKVPVFIDFWAPWCGPCQSMLPIIGEVAGEYKEDIVKIAKFNIDESKGVPGQFGIMSVPTFMIFKDGQIIDQFVGAQSKDSLKERIGQVLEVNE